MSKETTIPEGRCRLAAVVREAGDIVRIADAERALDVSRTVAAKLLSRWSGQGWLRRVGPGAYAPVSLDSLVSEQVLDAVVEGATENTVVVQVLIDRCSESLASTREFQKCSASRWPNARNADPRASPCRG